MGTLLMRKVLETTVFFLYGEPERGLGSSEKTGKSHRGRSFGGASVLDLTCCSGVVIVEVTGRLVWRQTGGKPTCEALRVTQHEGSAYKITREARSRTPNARAGTA